MINLEIKMFYSQTMMFLIMFILIIKCPQLVSLMLCFLKKKVSRYRATCMKINRKQMYVQYINKAAISFEIFKTNITFRISLVVNH